MSFQIPVKCQLDPKPDPNDNLLNQILADLSAYIAARVGSQRAPQRLGVILSLLRDLKEAVLILRASPQDLSSIVKEEEPEITVLEEL
uniref:MitMem_reg domain-containing protein n=1 Tax=Bursaphelenchus xylophilus TaxID=6326 RepID=A0A1I7SHB0_BURXY